jgi:FtsH-binding integral membrane protein
VGVVVTHFDVDLVVKAFVITTGVFLALTAYTMQSKYDFSTWGARSVFYVPSQYSSKEAVY